MHAVIFWGRWYRLMFTLPLDTRMLLWREILKSNIVITVRSGDYYATDNKATHRSSLPKHSYIVVYIPPWTKS